VLVSRHLPSSASLDPSIRRYRLDRAPLHGLQPDLLLLTVPDDAITSVAKALAARLPAPSPAGVAFHLSGSRPRSDLDPLRKMGWSIGVFHPAATFPQLPADFDWRGRRVAIRGEKKALRFARLLASRLGALPFLLSDSKRVAYHLGLSLAAAGVTTILDLAEETIRGSGLTPTRSRALVADLAAATVSSYSRKGAERTLTGAVVRADRHVVEAHLQEFSERDSVRLLVELDRRTLQLARRSKRISSSGARSIEETLAKIPSRRKRR